MIRTDRTYFILLVALLGAIGIIDTAILNPTIAIYAQTLGADEFLASFIAGLYALVAIPASLVMGLTIDAIGRRRALIIGLGFTALWVYGYALAVTPTQLMLFRITHALSGSLVFPASIALIVDVARHRMRHNLSLYWLVIGAVIFIGSAVAGTLVTGLGFRGLFVLVAALSLAGMIIAVVVPETATQRVAPRVSLGILAGAIRWLSAAYLSIFALYFALGAIVGSLSLVLFLTGTGSEEQASATVGLYIALAVGISLPIFPFVGRMLRRFGTVRTLSSGLLLTALSQILLVYSLATGVLVVSAALLGGALALVYVGSTALAAVPQARGASIGLHQTANIAGIALGAPLSGLLLQWGGPLLPYLLGALVPLGILGLIVVSREAIHRIDLRVTGEEKAMFRGIPKERS